MLIPNVITPNGDGANETFTVAGLPGTAWRLEVYDRWGRRVAFYGHYRNEWRAEGLENGIYYYSLTGPAGNRRYKGWVHVLR